MASGKSAKTLARQVFGISTATGCAMTVALPGLYALLVLGASIQARARARLAFVALVPYAVAVASFQVNPGSGDPHWIGQAARASTSVFFAVNAGLLLLGASVALATALLALRDRRRAPAAFVLAGAAALALWPAAEIATAGGAGRSLLLGAGVAVVAAGAGTLIQWLRRGRVSGEPPARWPGLPGNRAAAITFGLGALGVVAGPSVGIVFLGLGAAAGASFLDRRAPGAARVPWLLGVAGVLAAVWWLLATIAGPVGLRVANLGDVPLSPRAEILLALPLGLVVWACFGLWPAHRVFPGGLFALLGALLWLRVGSPALPGGLEHWRPVLVPVGLIGLWGAAVTGRGASALSAIAFMTLASGARGSGLVALLLAGATLAAGRWPLWPPQIREPVQRLGWASAALLLPGALEAGFRTEVTYTVAAAAGLVLALWVGFASEGRPEQTPAGPAAS